MTLAKTAELARSSGKAAYTGTGDGGAGGGRSGKRGRKGGGGRKENVVMDLDAVCGGKVQLKREVCAIYLFFAWLVDQVSNHLRRTLKLFSLNCFSTGTSRSNTTAQPMRLWCTSNWVNAHQCSHAFLPRKVWLP